MKQDCIDAAADNIINSNENLARYESGAATDFHIRKKALDGHLFFIGQISQTSCWRLARKHRALSHLLAFQTVSKVVVAHFCKATTLLGIERTGGRE